MHRSLEEEGHELSDPPCVEDFERQLDRCLELIRAAPADALLDRCPLDFIAYLQTLGEHDALDERRDELRDVVGLLDLIVVVPIETPDRIALAPHEDARWRRRVDERLRTLFRFDAPGTSARSRGVESDTREDRR